MKNPLPTLTSLFAGTLLILFGSCGEQQADSAREQENTQAVEAPDQIVSIETARGYYSNYSDRRAALIRRYEDSIFRSEKIDSSFSVARYTSVDYTTLKQYLAYIEQESQKVGADISSLRIYFSNNPDEEGFVHPRQNSVFLLPAARPGNQGDREYGLFIDGKNPGYLSGNLETWNPDDPDTGARGERQEASLASLPKLLSLQTEGSLILNELGSSPPPNY